MVLGLLGAPLVAMGVVTVAWALTRPDDGVVASGVTLAGTELGGRSSDEVTAAVRDLARRFPDTAVVIETPEFSLETTAGRLGLSVDTGATRRAVLEAGRTDPGAWAPLRWARSLVADRPVEVALSVERATAEGALAELEGDRRVPVSEPSIDVSGDEVRLVPGRDGRAIGTDAVLDALPRRLGRLGAPIRVEARQDVTSPSVPDDAVRELADRANAISAEPIELTIGGTTATLPATELRAGFEVTVEDGEPRLGVDPDHVAGVLAALVPGAANPTGVSFDIVGGVPTPRAGRDAEVCCGPAAARQLADALLAGKRSVTLETRTVTAAEGVTWAQGLGVKEVIGEFTTRHPCCAPRVRNIHRISDLTRGSLIAPGETFSVNRSVGRRTAEKGFVNAPVIEQGEFKEDIGGGVSQYATTLFNAAFFGGLDIPEHKAHSIYISRYPFAREATLAYPSIDLKIRNDTPYGVVIWPVYTDSSITVQLWSTRHAVGAQTSINKTGGCGYVKLTRTRTYVADGRTETDDFTASYDCDPPSN